MLSEIELNSYIAECKSFWKVIDFKTEILDWEFKTNHPSNLVFNIGHPKNSHKGISVGDILPYTRLPELIKEKYPNTSKVTIPSWFYPMFKDNPYVDDFNGNPSKWGSLGPFGTSVDRTCNVWGFKCTNPTPIIYHNNVQYRPKNSLLFCIQSKTGGKIKNIKLFEKIIEDLKTKYYCVQLGLKDDALIRSANEHIFNLSVDNLIPVISQFDHYVGSQNSIYHLSKALGLNVVGILPKNIFPDLVVLPMLTQMNYREIEMLSDKDKIRPLKWKQWMLDNKQNPDESHHIGWLYPDTCHLTENDNGSRRCPTLSIDSLNSALNHQIFPFKDDRLWDFNKYKDLWLGDI